MSTRPEPGSRNKQKTLARTTGLIDQRIAEGQKDQVEAALVEVKAAFD